MSDKFLEIQDPVVSSFYDKLESCYDKTDELVEESNLMRKNILDYITSSEIATLGEAHCDSESSSLVEVSVPETPAATVSSLGTTVPPAATISSSSSSSSSSDSDSSVSSS